MQRIEHDTLRRLLLVAFAGGMAALVPQGPQAQTTDAFDSASLRGAGSTFAHPLMSAWANDYRAVRTGGVAIASAGGGLDDPVTGVALDYEAIGSQSGIQRLKGGAVDFAVSEMPLPADDLRRHGLRQVPLAVGGIAVVVNLPTLAGKTLQFSPAVLADVYLGKIRQWSDPAIAQLNPGVALPSAPIGVMHRSDGSGTTFAFTSYLAQVSPAWRAQVGSDLLVNWPVGDGLRGSAGLARAVQRTPHAMGYVDLVQARSHGLQVVSLQNTTGRGVLPQPQSIESAIAAASWNANDGFATSLLNRGGEGSYPIVTAVYALARERNRRAIEFLDWSLASGQPVATRLGYVAVPKSTVDQARAALKR